MNPTQPNQLESQSDTTPPAYPVQPSVVTSIPPQQSTASAPPDPSVNPDTLPEISWEASEFIDHRKSVSWYGVLSLATLVLAVVVYGITRDVISAAAVVAAATAFGGYAARHPRLLQFAIYEHGLQVGARYFSYTEFRSFAVVDDELSPSIIFMPLKRFGQLITIYFDRNDEFMIVDLLSTRLPIEPHKLDAFDRFMQRIHF